MQYYVRFRSIPGIAAAGSGATDNPFIILKRVRITGPRPERVLRLHAVPPTHPPTHPPIPSPPTHPPHPPSKKEGQTYRTLRTCPYPLGSFALIQSVHIKNISVSTYREHQATQVTDKSLPVNTSTNFQGNMLHEHLFEKVTTPPHPPISMLEQTWSSDWQTFVQ